MHLLVFRFSAMGDVALLTPVLQAVAHQNPNVRLTLVTRRKFAPFFAGIPNLTIFEADFDGQHQTFRGLLRLFRTLQKLGKFDCIVDAHQNLRSAVLRSLFALQGIRVVTLDKGRREKKALTRKENKVLQPLPHTVERYQHLFRQTGLTVEIGKPPFIQASQAPDDETFVFLKTNKIPFPKSQTWLGIAPFAQHAQKMWDSENFGPLLDKIFRQMPAIQVFLFGGGNEELEKLNELRQKFPQAVVVAGAMPLPAELALIRQLDLMLCMDSGNMHLAALSGVPVLSVWGATHPFAGFGPYGQPGEHLLQIPNETLTCRPCSVFGNKPCWRGDLACLHMISVDMVFERLQTLLDKEKP